MPIFVISTIKQRNGAFFPLIDDADLLGGFRAVATTTDRNDIHSSYRKEGMFVWTNDTEKLWRLAADLVSWTEVTFGGGSSNALTDTRTTGATLSAGMPVGVIASGNVEPSDAAGTLGPNEVVGLATSVSGPGTVSIVTHGVCPWGGAALTPGIPLFLAAGLGLLSASPPNLSVPGQRIVRVGTARTSDSIDVRVQVIGET
jgi:hypothetical protein